ncbi:hypothetical protein HCN09_01750 [Pseudomonas chlororaphis subsp. aurantiaca]|uniref:Uncharacterized protein n=1 Tax=Pseudomonas chlororaphis subsp. aurantiaca TaxID=86192 RepID=A0AAJ0ZNF7_9PSED|nr:hypothetical protein [Pseudomonas chlororaphis subsp. aurantiaca]QIT20485.1 hypothetical protein HCN09_01750 [Pseudomonas chlororaphis subsp. aurantiaca]
MPVLLCHFAPMIEEGVQCAEEWLEDSSLPLWWILSHHRTICSKSKANLRVGLCRFRGW